jgi:hypothetical protein
VEIAKLCAHSNTVVKNKKTATCAAKGYTGDKYCKDCGEKLSTGKAVAKTTKHTWNSDYTVDTAATTTAAGSKSIHCKVCDTIKSGSSVEIAKLCAHSNTVVKNKKTATCAATGYSGDKYCKDCGKKLSTGKTVAKTTKHTWNTTYTVDKKATTTAAGSKSIHCKVCDKIKSGSSVEIAKLCAHSNTVMKNKKTATCKAAGYTGDKYCKDCGKKLSTGKTVAKTTTHTWNNGKVTKAATATTTGIKTYTCKVCGKTKTKSIAAKGAPAKGTSLTDSKTKAVYKVTKSGLTGGTVTYVKSTNTKATTITIPATVTVEGITYKVTAVTANAFKNNTTITKLTVGSNVSTIGKNAFYGCKNLKTITLNTTKLKDANVGANAFKGINSKATINVPKSKLAAYKKILKNKGIGKNVTVKGV